jgi:purine-nucleoside phosphorylase
MVLGSGLGTLADEIEIESEFSFSDAGMPESSVPGHSGKFLRGRLVGAEVLVMKGRVHLYEGHSAQVVTAGVRWMVQQGVSSLVLTNAAGTLNADFSPGEWMMLSDHLNLTSASPLQGAEFVDMSEAYDARWRAAFREAAIALAIPLHEGVYAGLRGPQFETPAEIRMLRAIGADAVGMSTVLETIQARALGVPVVAFSCLTNWAAGISATLLNHEEVLETGKQAAGSMTSLLKRVISSDALAD